MSDTSDTILSSYLCNIFLTLCYCNAVIVLAHDDGMTTIKLK